MSIHIDGVTHIYDGASRVLALEDINIELEPGQIGVLIGPSGCGKTTLLNLVAGFLTPTQGTIRVDNSVINGTTSPSRMVVFQDHALFAWMTIEKNIMQGMYTRTDMSVAQKKERTSELISLIKLDGFEKSFPSQLSGGMRQRAGLARALAPEPEVLLLDEPFGALDAMTREKLQDDLKGLLQDARFTGLLVTHSIEEAAYLGDVVFIMTSRPGKVSAVWHPLASKEERSSRTTTAFIESVQHLRSEFNRVVQPART